VTRHRFHVERKCHVQIAENDLGFQKRSFLLAESPPSQLLTRPAAGSGLKGGSASEGERDHGECYPEVSNSPHSRSDTDCSDTSLPATSLLAPKTNNNPYQNHRLTAGDHQPEPKRAEQARPEPALETQPPVKNEGAAETKTQHQPRCGER